MNVEVDTEMLTALRPPRVLTRPKEINSQGWKSVCTGSPASLLAIELMDPYKLLQNIITKWLIMRGDN